MNDNLKIYNAVRAVPKEALKPIIGGRMKGMSDINPVWRIKALTEQFGACGIGWYVDFLDEWLEKGANDEVAAFVKVALYIKNGDEWSRPIHGVGGNSFIAKEKGGLYTSDECFKMAYTDAISVACKMLGVGADVYWGQDRTKYDRKEDEPKTPPKTEPKTEPKGEEYKAKLAELVALVSRKGYTMKNVCVRAKVNTIEQLTMENINEYIIKFGMLPDKEEEE